MKIQRLSVSTFKFISPRGKNIIVDPWLTGDPVWPREERKEEKLAALDVMLITHGHFDHASGIDEISKINPKIQIIAQYELALKLISQGKANVCPMNYGGTLIFDNIKYSMVGALHTSSIDDLKAQPTVVGNAAGYVIEFEDGFKVYSAGDTALTSDMKLVVADYFKPDLAILPAVGFMVMEPEEAALAASIINPKYVIPFHDFPPSSSQTADPEGYEAFCKQQPIVLVTKAKIDRFVELMKKYRKIKTIVLGFGETKEIK